MFSLCPSVSHHLGWAFDVFELFREEAGDERDQDSCQNLPFCCLKFSFVADACAQLHLEVEEDPAQYLLLSPSFPFSDSRVHNLQSSSLGYSCTNIASSLASLAFGSNIVHHLCICLSVRTGQKSHHDQWRGWKTASRSWGQICHLFLVGPFLPLPIVAALQPNVLRLGSADKRDWKGTISFTSISRDCSRDYSLLKSSLQLFYVWKASPASKSGPGLQVWGTMFWWSPSETGASTWGCWGSWDCSLAALSGATSHCPLQPTPKVVHRAVWAAHTDRGAARGSGLWQEPTQIPTVRDRREQPLGHGRLLAAGWAGLQFSCLSLQFCIAPVNRAWHDKPSTPSVQLLFLLSLKKMSQKGWGCSTFDIPLSSWWAPWGEVSWWSWNCSLHKCCHSAGLP